MTIYHTDANVVADIGRGNHPQVTQRFASLLPGSVAISVIVVGELRVGVEKTGSTEEMRKLTTFLAPIPIVDITEAVAEEYARLRTHLEAAGRKMDGNDLWIAASALVHQATLVTADEAFSRVPNLRTENWRSGK